MAPVHYDPLRSGNRYQYLDHTLRGIPILWMFSIPVPEFMVIPEQVWTLITIGLGGYVGGRSGEKMVKAWKEK